ncbi:hypothetical protein [Xanthomonas phaseoli]|uniref:hypothetical protein n=1 Tax=Xanthomonas phaseoli TaxID=1985254 RepID=UPI001E48568D|nr:hypothetical protein [Xanthomonas phaseoli]MCC8471515.1 hypothetical protein [Xanthomonas phaseoli]
MSGKIKIKSAAPSPRYVVIKQQIEDPSAPGTYITIYVIYDTHAKKLLPKLYLDPNNAHSRCNALNDRQFKATPSP